MSTTKHDKGDQLPDGVPHPDHLLANAAALSGGIVGAVVGSLAGPIGALAGGAFGTALGAIGGRTIENDEHRAEARDHELDDAIGVTKGSLGVPDEAKRPSSPPIGRESEK